MSAISFEEAIAFVWGETELLDRLAYRDWLKLWASEGLYIIPIDRDDGDPAEKLNIAYDDEEMRQARVKRLLSGFSMSSAPPARTVRSLSRFVIGAQEADRIELRAAQTLVEYKYSRTRVLAADMQYHLVRLETGIVMTRKVVRLINSDDDQFGMGYLL